MLEKVKSNRYYGSDLNRFIDERCSHEMTCNNIDCLLMKVAKKHIRFIESKQTFESMQKSQLTLLKILKWIYENPEEAKRQGWKVDFNIVSGTYPYRNGAIAMEVGSNRSFQLNQYELIQFLEFRKEAGLV